MNIKVTDASGGQTLPDYRQFHLSRNQYVGSVAVGMIGVFAAGYLFYHSVIVALLLSAFGIYAPRLYRKRLAVLRRERLKLQFKEALFSLTSSLAAGRSVENAFRLVAADLLLVYPGGQADILQEFERIGYRLDNGEPLEHGLREFSERSGVEEIVHFTDVFCIGKRSGGDLVELIRQTSQTIGEKMDIQLEIAVMIAQKKFESRIMMAVPFAFLAFLAYAAPDYMAPLYQGVGFLLLTAALLLLLGCYWWIGKLMNIRI
ncbi:pilus assembly protein TadB [Paenibacillaceae bacterium]|nr:pilus assembly protein TadB [Paenibacillaceae bacterium]